MTPDSFTPRNLAGLGLAAAVCALTGCQAEGSVRIVIDEPEVVALSPLDDRLATVALTVETPGAPSQVFGGSAAAREPLPLGDFRVGDGATFQLEGRALGGRLVGYGRVLEPTDISATDETVIHIPFRRPYAYVATGDALVAFNTAVDTADGFELTAWTSPQTTAVAPTPDGLDVLVASNGKVLLLDTSTHTPHGGEASAGDVADMVISPDGHHAALLHTASPSGVTIVDLDALRAGSRDEASFFVPVENATGLDISDARAWVLASDDRVSCALDSTLRGVAFVDGVGLDPPKPLGGCATAIDVSSDGLKVAVAIRERGLVVRSLEEDTVPEVEVALNAPTAVTIAAGRAFAVGAIDGVEGTGLVIASVGLDGGGPVMLELPPDEIAPTYDLATEAGQTVQLSRRLAADELDALDVSALPDGSAIAVWTTTKFHGAAETVAIPTTGGDVLVDLDTVDVSTAEYLLLDAREGIPIQGARTSCRLSDPSPERDCGVTTQARFTAQGGAILYGDR